MSKDRRPLTAAEWRKLGDGVDALLLEAAADASLVYGARERAVAGLGALGGAPAQEFLNGMLADSKTAPVLLAAAVRAYAKGFGTSDAAGTERIASGLLGHADWMVRRAAVAALGGLASPSARAALVAHQSHEEHPAVLGTLRAELERKKDAR
jgi:HEAT repeat protein